MRMWVCLCVYTSRKQTYTSTLKSQKQYMAQLVTLILCVLITAEQTRKMYLLQKIYESSFTYPFYKIYGERIVDSLLYGKYIYWCVKQRTVVGQNGDVLWCTRARNGKHSIYFHSDVCNALYIMRNGLPMSVWIGEWMYSYIHVHIDAIEFKLLVCIWIMKNVYSYHFYENLCILSELSKIFTLV